MSAVAASLAAAAVLVAVAGRRPLRLVDRIGVYLRRAAIQLEAAPPTDARLAQAGLDWSPRTLAVRRAWAGTIGAFVGLLLAQGDLFIAGSGRSVPGLAALGAAAGVLALNIWITRRRERRMEQLKQEIATVADAIALHVLAGESIASSIERLVAGAQGVAVEELARALAAHHDGDGLAEVLTRAGRDTVYPEAGRFYTLLANAHEAGGRLADSLAELAADYRAALARDITAEGGRRALATYGPILALMVPVALVFLMYPTLVGLRELSQGP